MNNKSSRGSSKTNDNNGHDFPRFMRNAFIKNNKITFARSVIPIDTKKQNKVGDTVNNSISSIMGYWKKLGKATSLTFGMDAEKVKVTEIKPTRKTIVDDEGRLETHRGDLKYDYKNSARGGLDVHTTPEPTGRVESQKHTHPLDLDLLKNENKKNVFDRIAPRIEGKLKIRESPRDVLSYALSTSKSSSASSDAGTHRSSSSSTSSFAKAGLPTSSKSIENDGNHLPIVREADLLQLEDETDDDDDYDDDYEEEDEEFLEHENLINVIHHEGNDNHMYSREEPIAHSSGHNKLVQNITSRDVSVHDESELLVQSADNENETTARSKSAQKDNKILSKLQLSINRVVDIISNENNLIMIGRYKMRLRELISSRFTAHYQTSSVRSIFPQTMSTPSQSDRRRRSITTQSEKPIVDIFRCRAEPESCNIALKSITIESPFQNGLPDPSPAKKIANLVRAFNEIEVMEELRYERNAVQLVTSAFREQPISFKTEFQKSSDIATSPAIEKGGLTLVMMLEWCGGGSVQDLVNKQQESFLTSDPMRHPLPERVVVSVMRAVCNPLLKMHNRSPKHVSHRNICPQSILITSRGLVKLSQFTSCVYGETRMKSYNENSTNQVTKNATNDTDIESLLRTHPAVRAPEQLLLLEHLRRTYSQSHDITKQIDFVIEKAVDVWQLGCCFYALAYGEMPFGEEGLQSNLTRRATKNIESINEHIRNRIHEGNKCKSRYSSELAMIIEKLLQYDPQDRPSIEEVINYMDEHLQLIDVKAYEAKLEAKKISLSHEDPYEMTNTETVDNVIVRAEEADGVQKMKIVAVDSKNDNVIPLNVNVVMNASKNYDEDDIWSCALTPTSAQSQ